MFTNPFRYVLPTPPRLKGKIDKKYNRLYAYPSIPEEPSENGFVILDSGAFGLSMQNKEITPAYMQRLAEHYAKYSTQNYIKVAPDVFKYPDKTMQNYLFWQNEGYPIASPVLQFAEDRITEYELEKQLDFYCSIQEIDFLLISNKGNKAVDLISQNVIDKLLKMRSKYPVKWIHFLGAGWNIEDCSLYSEIINEGALDTIDSIAYYNTAHSETENFKHWNIQNGSFSKNAIANAELINQIIYKY